MRFRRLTGMIAIGVLSASTAAGAASEQGLRLADGLLDKEAVCTVYMHTQRGALQNLAASWTTDRREQAGGALYAELSPLLSDICAKGWAVARVRLAEAIEAEMPAADRALLDRFLSSSAGVKFIAGARSHAIGMIPGARPAPPPSVSSAEQGLAVSTFSSAAWAKYKLWHPRAKALFGEAQESESRPYEARFQALIQAVRARFER